MHDLASSKKMINYTLRTIGEACLEVRNKKSQLLFGKDFFDLDGEKQNAIELAVPVWFSLESPKIVKSPPPPPPKVIEVIPKKGKIPFITFHKTWINVNGESCELEQMNAVLEKLLSENGNARQV
jgi:hypothetical protein